MNCCCWGHMQLRAAQKPGQEPFCVLLAAVRSQDDPCSDGNIRGDHVSLYFVSDSESLFTRALEQCVAVRKQKIAV